MRISFGGQENRDDNAFEGPPERVDLPLITVIIVIVCFVVTGIRIVMVRFRALCS